MDSSLSSKILCYVILLASLMVISCDKTNGDIDRILSDAENLVVQNPDSASRLLDSIPLPHLLQNRELYLYVLFRVQSKDLSYQNITSDTAIFKAKEYFINDKDIVRSAFASYYSGRVLFEQQDYKHAMTNYLQANEFANKLDTHYQLKGTINANLGYLLFRQDMFDGALMYFHKAISYFELAQDLEREVAVYSSIGDCFAIENQLDSAWHYYTKGLMLSEIIESPQLRINVLHNMAVTYREIGDYSQAKKLFLQTVPLIDDETNKAKLFSNLGLTFYIENKTDSASYYLNKSLELFDEETDFYDLSLVYNILSNLNDCSRNYTLALDYERKYSACLNQILMETEKKEVLEIQKKYEYQKILNHNNELFIHKQKTILVSTIILFILIICFTLTAISYYYRLKKKEISLIEAEDKISNLNLLALSFNENENTFRNKLLEHFDILKKSAMLESFLRKEEIEQGQKLLMKFNEIVYKQNALDWNVLYDTMNSLNYHFLDKLKNMIPDLDEDEFRICCLIFSDFSNQEISIIMKLSSSTITHKRSSIRSKIGLQEYGNISDFLQKSFKESRN